MSVEAARRIVVAGVCAVGVIVVAACARVRYDPARATRPYPHHLHRAVAVDIQVFRDSETIEIVNSTARSYSDFDLWVNQRYVQHIAGLAPGQTIRLSLWDFYDERGEVINAGGFWRTEPPTPVRLVEIQPGAEEPMIGLITIREED
ncbi:MAG: hypothetical protein IH804_03220 [Planctomycetes bacterium]|nr:hypothetical protein [Planctomycetota bacterium]